MKCIKYIIISFFTFASLMVVNSSFAGEYKIKTMTSEVKSALNSRKNRYEKIKSLKQNNSVGESNRGYVEAFAESVEIAQIAKAENRDRKTIYQTIANQNGLSGKLGMVEKVFAQVKRDKASVGERIQKENGEWVKK
jgi:uncharacterized protein YdbL (DUF1318 family)